MRRACKKYNIAAASYDPDAIAAVTDAPLQPTALWKVAVFHWNHVRFLWLRFLASVEATKVLAPHNEKQRRTIVIFAVQLMDFLIAMPFTVQSLPSGADK